MQQMTTHVTAVPSGDDEGSRRHRQLADRDTELSRYGRSGWALHSTHTIVGADRVISVDTLTRTTLSD